MGDQYKRLLLLTGISFLIGLSIGDEPLNTNLVTVVKLDYVSDYVGLFDPVVYKDGQWVLAKAERGYIHTNIVVGKNESCVYLQASGKVEFIRHPFEVGETYYVDKNGNLNTHRDSITDLALYAESHNWLIIYSGLAHEK